MKKIITDLALLSERADEIFDIRKNSKEVQQITIELKEVLRANPTLTALSAPQIGYKKRVFVINFKGDLRTFVNPVINYSMVKGMGLSIEECPSIPGKKFLMIRNQEIPIMYQTPIGQISNCTLNGASAYVFQRMMNNLDGVLLSDMGLEINDDFINASEEEKAPIIQKYLEALDLKQKAIQEDISKSEDLTQIKEAGEFMESVQKGETVVSVTQEPIPEIKPKRGRKKKE